MLMRIAAAAVVVCLVAPSVARIACGWECVNQRAASEVAACHQHQPDGANAVTRSALIACHDDPTPSVTRGVSVLPEAAAVLHAGSPPHRPPVLWSPAVASLDTSALPGSRLSSIQLRI
jgi:hypothetical protein